VGYIERGERNVGIDNLERLARALGVPVAALFESGNEQWSGQGGGISADAWSEQQ
jgi:transcriptional regulator with XRE-family HTH domain